MNDIAPEIFLSVLWPRDLLLRRQAHADGLRALRQLHHVVRLFRLFSGSEPLRLRERPARLKLLECAATQPSHLRLRRPSGFRLPAVPSPRGPVSRFRRDIGSTARRSSRSLGSRSSLSGPCNSQCRFGARTPTPSLRESCASFPCSRRTGTSAPCIRT